MNHSIHEGFLTDRMPFEGKVGEGVQDDQLCRGEQIDVARQIGVDQFHCRKKTPVSRNAQIECRRMVAAILDLYCRNIHISNLKKTKSMEDPTLLLKYIFLVRFEKNMGKYANRW